MFSHSLTIQLHHTDSYGILFFANQLRFCHDVFQAWLTAEGLPMAKNRQLSRFVAVVVHAESDYESPIELGDQLTLGMTCTHIGTTSFTNAVSFTNQRGVLVGAAKVTMVTIDPLTSTKIAIPTQLREALEGNR